MAPETLPQGICGIWERVGKGYGLVCSATLINSKTLQTAGHCFNGDRSKETLYYSCDRAPRVSSLRPLLSRAGALNYFVNPKYPRNTNLPEEDLAFVTLPEPAEGVDPVPLARDAAHTKTLLEKADCAVAGFGPNNDGKGDQLRAGRASPITRDEARVRALPEGATRVLERDWDPRNALVMGAEESQVQAGDSGGALLCRDREGRWFQVGVTSQAIAEDGKRWREQADPAVKVNVFAPVNTNRIADLLPKQAPTPQASGQPVRAERALKNTRAQ